MKMYVWTDHFSFLATAHAESVAEARKLMLVEMGESGDGSCPERDKARRFVLEVQPAIWMGPNAEFTLSDGAELREQVSYLEKVQAELRNAKEQLKAFAAAVPALSVSSVVEKRAVPAALTCEDDFEGAPA